MKVVSFQVPQTKKEAFRIQVDRLPHFYDKLHQHHEFQLMYIQQSEGTLVAGDYIGRFEPGDLYLIGSNQAHVFRNDEIYFSKKKNSAATSLSILFDENYLGDHFWQLEEMKGLKLFLAKASNGFKVDGNTKDQIIELILISQTQSGVPRLLSFFSILKLLTESDELTKLSLSSSPSSRNSEGKRMNEVLQFTFRESHRKIYIKDVARIAHMTPEAFCRYFKTRTCKTYSNFLNEVRISNASKLLIDKDLSVQDVCYQSGFSNVSNFNRIFKKLKGKTPSRYKLN